MKSSRFLSGLLALACVLGLAACGPPKPAPDSAGRLLGQWRGVLNSPGGELPFQMRFERGPEEGDEEGALQAVVLNGEEEAPVSRVEVDGREVLLAFDGYDSRITARLSADGRSLDGSWEKIVPEGVTRLDFAAQKGDPRRFVPLVDFVPQGEGGSRPDPASVTGTWTVLFRDEDGTEPARAELVQETNDPSFDRDRSSRAGDRVTGTFLTPTGDYRYLEGVYEGGLLRLSTFDGAHAFLFVAKTRDDGTLRGDFWSRDTYHATWTARRAEAGEEILPDSWNEVSLTNDEGRFRFAFPDLEGSLITSEDPRYDGKVVLVNLFGSWCPNCNDEAPLLAEWHRRYGDRGLEIVGLAYEFSGDPERDRLFVQRYADRHGLEFPLLLAGTSDKADAAATLPDLTAVRAYPTTVFIGRDGKVRKIHSGFAGPGTGVHHEELVAEMEGVVEGLLGK